MLTKISAVACAFLMTGCSAINYINPFDDEHVNPVGAGPLFPTTKNDKGEIVTNRPTLVPGDNDKNRSELALLVSQ